MTRIGQALGGSGSGIPGPAGADGADGLGVPPGGTTGQILAKVSNADNDTHWTTGGGGAVDSVNTKTGVVVLNQDEILDGTTYKQYSATEKTKLSGIATGAEVNVNADWDAVSGDAQILNKPTIPTAYTLPTASDTVKGGVKIGARLTMTGEVLSADVQTTDISGKENTGVAAGLLSGHTTTYDHTLLHAAGSDNQDLSGYLTSATAASTYEPLKGATDNYLTDTEQTKLAGIATGAEVNVNADWNAVSGDAVISNKPTLGTAAAKNIPATGNASATEVVYGSDTRLSDTRTPTSHNNSAHSETYITSASAVAPNTAITGATKTKITYDAKGLVTTGADATTADIADSTNKRYVTDAQATVIGNTSGTNSGDNATNTQYSGLVTNATHTGDVTGSGALTIATGAVTLAKMADMATASLIYRKTALSGAPEVNSLATLKTDLGLTGTNSGDQDLSGLAVRALSNLASVAINESLVSDTDSTDDLGSTTVAWANVYADTIKSITGNALALTPVAGQSLTVNLSTTGDFIVNTSQIYADTSSGFVGIGTTAPPRPLTVQLDSANTNAIVHTIASARTTSGTAANGIGAGLEFYIEDDAGALQEAGSIATILSDVTSGSIDSDIVFQNRLNSGAFVERMRITAAGNVGIGTTSPSVKLQVLDSLAGDLTMRLKNDNVGSTAARSLLTVDIDSVVTQLISYGAAFTTSGAQRQASTLLYGNGLGGLSIAAANSTSGAIRFYTDGIADANNRMTIANDGKVGIAVTAPAATLEIGASSANVEIQRFSYAADPTFYSYIRTRVSGSTDNLNQIGFVIGDASKAHAEVLTISGDGSVGIGVTSATGLLHIDQSSTTAAIPTLILDQADVSEEFIEFVGTSAANNTNTISTTAVGTYAGKYRINVNGTYYWTPFYNA